MSGATTPRLTHLDADGRAVMVDVGDKAVTQRRAVARCHVAMRRATLDAILEGSVPKGDVLAVARVAGIMAAKRTAELIPLCHPLPLSAVSISIEPESAEPDAGGKGGETALRISATVATTARTGVEMEALTAASVAALTIYDMCKALDRAMCIGNLRVVEKSGGRSGATKEE